MRPESLEKETGQTDGSKDRSGRGADVPALEDRTAGSSPAQEQNSPPVCTRCEQQSVQIAVLPYILFILFSLSILDRSLLAERFPECPEILFGSWRESSIFNRPVNLETLRVPHTLRLPISKRIIWTEYPIVDRTPPMPRSGFPFSKASRSFGSRRIAIMS